MSIVDNAQRLIHGKGQNVTYIAVMPGVYDTSTGKTMLATASRTVKAVVSHVRREGGRGLVAQSDVLVTLAAADFASSPKNADRLAFGGFEFAIVSVEPQFYQDKTVTYIVRGRQT